MCSASRMASWSTAGWLLTPDNADSSVWAFRSQSSYRPILRLPLERQKIPRVYLHYYYNSVSLTFVFILSWNFCPDVSPCGVPFLGIWNTHYNYRYHYRSWDRGGNCCYISVSIHLFLNSTCMCTAASAFDLSISFLLCTKEVDSHWGRRCRAQIPPAACGCLFYYFQNNCVSAKS